MFEKKNQKSTQTLSTLQKKLEKYTKSLNEVQTFGAHRQTKDKLKDMGQGLKWVHFCHSLILILSWIGCQYGCLETCVLLKEDGISCKQSKVNQPVFCYVFDKVGVFFFYWNSQFYKTHLVNICNRLTCFCKCLGINSE